MSGKDMATAIAMQVTKPYGIPVDLDELKREPMFQTLVDRVARDRTTITLAALAADAFNAGYALALATQTRPIGFGQ